MNYTFAFDNVTAIVLVLCVQICAWKGRDHAYADARMIIIIAKLTAIEAAGEIVAVLSEHWTDLVWLNYAANTVLYVANVLIAFVWVRFLVYKVHGNDYKIDRVKFAIACIPGALILLGTLINLFTPVFFHVTEENVYVRALLYPAAALNALLYITGGYLYFHKNRRRNQRYAFYPVIAFLLPVLGYQISQMLFPKYLVGNLGLALGTTSLYLSFKNEAAYIDAMSGLYNSRYFDRSLELYTPEANRTSQQILGVMIDIDGFKRINDTYGHLEGNKAICDTAEILTKTCKAVRNQTFAFRYGGDEFVLLQRGGDKDSPLLLLKALQEELEIFNRSTTAPYKLQFSVGYTLWQYKDDSIKNFVDRMDHEMYKDKRAKAERIAAFSEEPIQRVSGR